jgi:hypothetical protein
MRFQGARLSPLLEYSAADRGWTFADVCGFGGPILVRNAVCHEGEVFAVLSVSASAFEACRVTAVLISGNVASLGKTCFKQCRTLQIVAFEDDSHLSGISSDAFYRCESLRSIAIPFFVTILGEGCFYWCRSR